jgi:hypothetical protein
MEHLLQSRYAGFWLTFALKCIHQLHQCIGVPDHLLVGKLIARHRLCQVILESLDGFPMFPFTLQCPGLLEEAIIGQADTAYQHERME